MLRWTPPAMQAIDRKLPQRADASLESNFYNAIPDFTNAASMADRFSDSGIRETLRNTEESAFDWALSRFGMAFANDYQRYLTECTQPNRIPPMLVLTRKLNQAIHIGDNIVITITKIRGDAVRLGIQAPQDVKVMRSELLDAPAKKQAPLKILKPDCDLEASSEELSFELLDDGSDLDVELDDEPLFVGTIG